MTTRIISLFTFFLLIGATANAMQGNSCGQWVGSRYILQMGQAQVEVSLISESDLNKIFNDLKNSKYKIPYLNSAENCNYRAHRISQVLFSKYKLMTAKVFLMTDHSSQSVYGGNPLTAIDVMGIRRSWTGYHTSAAICARTAQGDHLFMLDHSLSNEPMRYEDWRKMLTQSLLSDEYSVRLGRTFDLNPFNPYSVNTTFDPSEMKQVDQILSLDWPLHRELLK